jgi:hypothetical protein
MKIKELQHVWYCQHVNVPTRPMRAPVDRILGVSRMPVNWWRDLAYQDVMFSLAHITHVRIPTLCTDYADCLHSIHCTRHVAN